MEERSLDCDQPASIVVAGIEFLRPQAFLPIISPRCQMLQAGLKSCKVCVNFVFGRIVRGDDAPTALDTTVEHQVIGHFEIL